MKTLLNYQNIIRFLVAGVVLLATLGFTSAVAAQSSCGSTYVVQPGDYLMKIARTCGVSYSNLLNANPAITHPSLIFAGQVLNIPSSSIPVTGSQPGVYTVQQGDTLFSISQKYHLTVDDLGLANSNVGSTLTAGQVLNIPLRVRFATGGTSATLTGTVPATLSHFFILQAAKGQTLNVTVTPQDKLQLSIYGADGNVLRSGMGEGSSFSGVLPSTQDYVLVLKNANQDQAYTLNVSIPATPPIPVTGTSSYTVKQGDTLFSIASRFQTTVPVLLRANPEITNMNLIPVGQVIYLPGATLTLANGQVVYIAKSGDTMGAIARQFNKPLSGLISANPQISNPDLIYAGQRINIP